MDPFPDLRGFTTDTVFDFTRDREFMILIRSQPGPIGHTGMLTSREGRKYRELARLQVAPTGTDADAIGLSPAGDKLLWTNYKRAHVLDARTGRIRYPLRTADGIFRMMAAAWLDGGSRLLGLVATDKPIGQVGSRNRIMLWDGNTGNKLKELEQPTPAHLLATSPDESLFAEAGSDMVIRIRALADLRTCREIHGHDAPVSALSWHPTSNVIASASVDLAIRLWDANTGDQLAEIHGCSATPVGLRFSPAGDLIAASTGSPEKWLRVWQNPLVKERAKQITKPKHKPANLITKPATKAVPVISNPTLTVLSLTNQLELETKTVLGVRAKRTVAVNTWDFIGDHTVVHSAANEGRATIVNLQPGRTNEIPALSELSGPVTMDILPDRSAALFVSNDRDQEKRRWLHLRMIDGEYSPVGRLAFDDPIQPIDLFRLTPDGKQFLYTSYMVVKLTDLRTRRNLRSFRQGRFPFVFRILDSAWLHGGDQLLAIGFTDKPIGKRGSKNRIFVWDTETGRLLRSIQHDSLLHTLAIAPKGDRFAEAGVDGKIRIRSTKTLELITEIAAHADEIEGLAWHPTADLIASASKDRRLRFSDPTKGDDFPVVQLDTRDETKLDRYIRSRSGWANNEWIGPTKGVMSTNEFRKLVMKGWAAADEILKLNEGARMASGELYRPLLMMGLVSNDRQLKLPHDYQYDDAKPLDLVTAGTMFGSSVAESGDRHQQLENYAIWMTSSSTPRFTRVLVNRLWKFAFGVGLFEPVDSLTGYTKISNPELLYHLEKVMIESGYDTKHLLEVIFNSRAWQRAAHTEEIIAGQPYHFPGPKLRRMTAEQIWDSLTALSIKNPDEYRPNERTQLIRLEKERLQWNSVKGADYGRFVALMDEYAPRAANIAQERRRLAMAGMEAAAKKDRELSRELRTKSRRLIEDFKESISERGWPDLATLELDRLSIAHVGLLGAATVFWSWLRGAETIAVMGRTTVTRGGAAVFG
ncbi:MAG: DUF1553 domain-containing protein [Limisphaerales bacterium]